MERILYTKRYAWTLCDTPDQVNIKIICDLDSGHLDFVNHLTEHFGDNLLILTSEYLCEYNFSCLGEVKVVLDNRSLEDNVNDNNVNDNDNNKEVFE